MEGSVKLMGLTVGAIAMAAAEPAAAQAVKNAAAGTGSPTYLSCNLKEGSTTQAIALTVDESRQAVTIHQKNTERVVTGRAVFTPETVTLPDGESTWAIDRVTLELSRVVVIGDQSWNDMGQCKLAETPAKRVF